MHDRTAWRSKDAHEIELVSCESRSLWSGCIRCCDGVCVCVTARHSLRYLMIEPEQRSELMFDRNASSFSMQLPNTSEHAVVHTNMRAVIAHCAGPYLENGAVWVHGSRPAALACHPSLNAVTMLGLWLAFGSVALTSHSATQKVCNVLDFGAKGDNITEDTAVSTCSSLSINALQSAGRFRALKCFQAVTCCC